MDIRTSKEIDFRLEGHSRENKEMVFQIIKYYEDRERKSKALEMVATLFGFIMAVGIAIALTMALYRLETILIKVDRTVTRLESVENMMYTLSEKRMSQEGPKQIEQGGMVWGIQ